MTERSDELRFASLDGRPLPASSAELIHVPWGWQVELYDVPAKYCPLPRQVGTITLQTSDGQLCRGTAIVDLVSGEGTFVLLSGIGHLQLSSAAEAASVDTGTATDPCLSMPRSAA